MTADFDAVIAEARAWLKDCAWRDAEPEDIDVMPTWAIVGAVSRHYEGGWAAFLANTRELV